MSGALAPISIAPQSASAHRGRVTASLRSAQTAPLAPARDPASPCTQPAAAGSSAARTRPGAAACCERPSPEHGTRAQAVASLAAFPLQQSGVAATEVVRREPETFPLWPWGETLRPCPGRCLAVWRATGTRQTRVGRAGGSQQHRPSRHRAGGARLPPRPPGGSRGATPARGQRAWGACRDGGGGACTPGSSRSGPSERPARRGLRPVPGRAGGGPARGWTSCPPSPSTGKPPPQPPESSSNGKERSSPSPCTLRLRRL